MQFDEVLVREDVIAADTLAIVDPLSPDSCELQVSGQVPMDL